MEALVIVAGIGVAGAGFYLLGSQPTQRPLAIGLAVAGVIIAGATALTMSDNDDGAGGNEDVATGTPTSEPTAPPATDTSQPDETTTTEFVPATNEPGAEPENISIIPECFDTLHQDDPPVSSDHYRLLVDNNEDRTAEVPLGHPTAIFIIEDNAVVGSVRFEYSTNDTLTVYDAVDDQCSQVQWEQTDTQLRSSTIAVNTSNDTQYEIVFEFGPRGDDRKATIHRLDN